MNDGLSPVEKVLDRMEGYKERRDEFRARCPAHNGNSEDSLSIKEGDDRRAILFCHAGCELRDIVDALGLGVVDLFVHNRRNTGAAKKARSPEAKTQTTADETLTTDELPDGIYYEFTSPAGEILYIQRHKGAYYRKVGDGLWKTGLEGVSQVLYNLHELLDGVRAGKTIYHLEGCKDVETAKEGLDVVATTSGGVDTWREEFKSFYTGTDVVIVPDNDKEGKRYARRVARDVLQVARSIKVVELPGLPDKGDLTDWLESGHTKEEFFSVVANSGDIEDSGDSVRDEKVEPWAPPAAFHSFDLPPFPTGVFPNWLEDYVSAVAEATQTPRDLGSMLALTVGAAACAKVVDVEVWEGWREPANLYTATVLRPGTRKTEVFRRMCAPLVETEKELIKSKTPEVAEAETRYRVGEQRLKKAEAQAAKAQGDEFESLTADAMSAARDLASMKVPSAPQLLADDVTPERVAGILSEQGGRIAVMSDEGGIFDILAGRYSQGVPNLDTYLKGHAGMDIRIDRVGRPADMVREPAITTGLAVQPDVLRGLAARPGFRGRGLLGRFLYSIPPDTLGSRKSKQPAVDGEKKENYHYKIKHMAKLIESPLGEDHKPHVLTLESGAQNEMEDFSDWIEPQLADDGHLGDMTNWAGKLAGAVARIAGILHMFDHAGKMEPWKHKMSADVVRRAIKVGRYLIPHARYAMAHMGSDSRVEDAKYILRWIERKGCEWFTKREAWQDTKGRFDTVADLESGLEILIEHGYIREDPNQPPHRGPGRKPSPRYEVNPLFEAKRYPHNPHNPQNTHLEGNSGDIGGSGDGIWAEKDEMVF